MSKPQKPAIAYLRVSTQKQGNDGHGLEIQLAAIEAFAKASGYEIMETFRDVHTGMGADSVRSRPTAVKAVLLSRDKRWPIIVDGLDRFSRHVATLEKMIADNKIAIISTKSGASNSPAVMIAEAARGQRQGELISASTKRGLLEVQARGVRLGNPTNLPEAQAKGAASNKGRAEARARELLPVIQELRAAGKTKADEVAKGLNEKGLQTPRGGTWNGTNVRRLLGRAKEMAPAYEAAAQAERYKDHSLWGTFSAG